MLTLLELLLSLIISFVLIFLYKVQSEVHPRSYFSTSDLFKDIADPITRLDIVIRFFISFMLAFVLYFFIDNHQVILLGITLGSFLIVWPVFLNSENIEPHLQSRKNLYYALLLLFVVGSFAISILAYFLFNLTHLLIESYLATFNLQKFINLIMDNLLWIVLFMLSSSLSKVLRKLLNKDVSFYETNEETCQESADVDE